MDTRKVLSGLCYFSIFFAAILFPLVVFLASGDVVTKANAKKAFLSHLVPLIPIPLFIAAIIFQVNSSHIRIFTVVSVLLMVAVTLITVIWNIVKGVKAFTGE